MTDDESGGYWPLGRDLSALLTDGQLRAVLQVSEATFYRFKAAGRFKRFLADPQLSSRHTRYSGELVRAYVRGLPIVRRG